MSDLDSVGGHGADADSHPLVMIAVRMSPLRQIVIFPAYRANAPSPAGSAGYRVPRYADLSHAGTVSTGRYDARMPRSCRWNAMALSHKVPVGFAAQARNAIQSHQHHQHRRPGQLMDRGGAA